MNEPHTLEIHGLNYTDSGITIRCYERGFNRLYDDTIPRPQRSPVCKSEYMIDSANISRCLRLLDNAITSGIVSYDQLREIRNRIQVTHPELPH